MRGNTSACVYEIFNQRHLLLQVEARWIIPLIAKKNEVFALKGLRNSSLFLTSLQVMAHPKFQAKTAAEVLLLLRFSVVCAAQHRRQVEQHLRVQSMSTNTSPWCVSSSRFSYSAHVGD